MIPLALCLLALADAGLSGFRAAAGRNPLVHKFAYYRTAVLRGIATGSGALAAIGVAFGFMLIATDDAVRYELLVDRGRAMLSVYVPFATLVAIAFGLYAIRSVDLRSVLSTGIFGPVTLIRPLIIILGALAAAWGTPWDVRLAALFAAAAVLAVEPIVGRRYAHWLTPMATSRR